MRPAGTVFQTLAFVVSALVTLAGSASGAPPAPDASTVRVEVEFLADGRCAVSGVGEGFHASMTYLPSPAVRPAAELRCTVPSAPRGRPVALRVVLPPGVQPFGDDFPRLSWSQQDGRWVGAALLPASPAFVSVPQPGAAPPARWVDGFAPPTPGSPLGLNFYGWFAFAAGFIAAYFTWARAMAARDRRRAGR